jgi:hypothetical protein
MSFNNIFNFNYKRNNLPIKFQNMNMEDNNHEIKISNKEMLTKEQKFHLVQNLIKVSLFKTFNGFGFTIIGANEKNKDFLQIKYVVPEGAAAKDGRLRQGDVLVYVNNICVLGYTHQDVVDIFKSIPVGNWVDLSVYRGHPLSIDLDDPNIQIMPLQAINNPNVSMSSNRAPIVSFDSVNDVSEDYIEEEVLVIIVKGSNGFGFTIGDDAESSYQRIKQIVNRDRCANLNENDLLFKINDYDLTNLNHSQVVEILKSCTCGQETKFKLKRKKYASVSPNSNKLSEKEKEIYTSKYSKLIIFLCYCKLSIVYI